MRVYAIRTGSYSDTSWGPVFSTLERALKYKGHKSETAIEVHVLDDENDTGPVYPAWVVVFDKEGNVLNVEERMKPAPFEKRLHNPITQRVPKDCHWYFLREYTKAFLTVDDIYAPDKAHAIKIAADNRTKYLAHA